MAQKLPLHQGFIFGRNGYFFDNTDTPIALFGVREFELLCTHLDALFESPMGRKLIYAGTDAEELVLSNHVMFRRPRFFGGKKIQVRLNARCISMGWGIFSLQNNHIMMPCHDAWSVGVALAHKEYLTQERWTMGWQQRSLERVDLDFEQKSESMVSVQKPPHLQWGADGESDTIQGEIDLELEARSYGFFRGQQRSFFVHISAFYQLYNALIGRPLYGQTSWLRDWHVEGTSSNECQLFASVAYAAKQGFQDSETPVFVQHSSDWAELFHIHLSQRGLGHVSMKSSLLDDDDATEFSVHSPLPALTCGILAGMFERGHGQSPIITVTIHPSKVLMSLNFHSVDYAVKT